MCVVGNLLMDYNITYREKDKGIQLIIRYKDYSSKWKQKSKQGFKKKSEVKNIVPGISGFGELKSKILAELFQYQTMHCNFCKNLKNYRLLI